MKKRFLCLFLALFLFVSLLPATALADGSAEKPDAKFDFILTGSETPEDADAALIMKAGDEAKYYTTKQSDSSLPDNWYLSPGTEAEWTVRFEYPADGIPTVTLKNAKIVNDCGLWFGGLNIPMTGDVKVVLEGDNYIGGGQKNGPLCFRTTGTTTVTGSGKLEFVSDANSKASALLMADGNLLLDNVDITMQMPETFGKTNGIGTSGGDVTIKGGSLTIVAYDNPKTLHNPDSDTGFRRNQEAIHSAVFIKKRADGTGGNLLLQDGAKMLVIASPYKNDNNKGFLMYTEGTFTIKDSSVELGLVGKVATGVSLFQQKPTLEYKDNTYSIIATRTVQPAYQHGVVSITPAMDRAVDYFNDTKLPLLTYFKVVPGGPGGPHCELPVVENEPQETVAPESQATEPKVTEATEKPTTATEEPTTATKEPTTATEEPTTAQTPTQAPTPTESQDNSASEKDTGNGVLVTVIVICALAVAGGGFALYWFVFKKK